MIISTNVGKAFDKIKQFLKILGKIGTEGNVLNLIKVYKLPTANTVLNGERLNVFSIRSGTRQGYPLSLHLFNSVLKILACAIKQEKVIKALKIGTEEIKPSVFTDESLTCGRS